MSPRADAVRSRERILDAARSHDVRALRLNDIARDAGVGIGTVYRHFPTVRSLIEALSLDSLARLTNAADAAAEDPDPQRALQRFLADALDLQLADAGLETVLTDLGRVDPAVHNECAAARTTILTGYAAVLTRAQHAGAVRRDLSPAQLQQLVCGIEHAVRLGHPADRTVLLDILLVGIRPAPAPARSSAD
ncbi:helix-turn-helix domain-containing protein [Microbacterium sp. NPDC089189]|uniref:TetR/AcrR family transcriptional regulator n=1 Tax=Microbacterium sp. NPDC089189 TaxID=3154972 RepID=UPI003414E016